MQLPSIPTSSVTTEHELCLLKRRQEDWYASTRNMAMYCLTVLFVAIAFALFTLSLLPQATIPFAGAYFVIGTFLFFIALGILLINFACQLVHLFKRTKVVELTTTVPNIQPEAVSEAPHQTQIVSSSEQAFS